MPHDEPGLGTAFQEALRRVTNDGMGFGEPWLLAILPPLVLAMLLLGRRPYWWLRVLAVTLLVVALAQPHLLQPGSTVVVLVDTSDSMGDSALEALERFDFSALEANVTPLLFAAETAAPGGVTAGERALLRSERTDLARALQVAHAAGADRILLLSDGGESSGDALAGLPPVAVDTYRVDPLPNARLAQLFVPDGAQPGTTVEAFALVESDLPADVTLLPRVGARPLEPVRRSVAAGATVIPFRFTVESEGELAVAARIEVDFEQPLADDEQQTSVGVAERSRVLVVDDPALADALEANGIDVQRGSPADVTRPLAYSAIVLRADARQFSAQQLTLLSAYVESGGGLLMTGGPQSFGLGGWYRTSLEEVLPVTTDLRTDVDVPLVAMVIVFDRSQSMSAGRPRRIELARQGAIDVVELAFAQDQLGLVLFDSVHEWAFELQTATPEAKRGMLQAILAIEPQGGTIVLPAYTEALEALAAADAAFRHVIILSDGEFFDGRGPFGSGSIPNFGRIAARALANGITTSTIALGEADYAQMQAIARSGGGRFYAVTDPTDLPRVFANEALTATRSLLREETLAPRVVRHPLTAETSAALPPLEAYIATSLKPRAETLLEGARSEPVLAVGRYGLGRSAALTTDLNAWAGDLASSEAFLGVVASTVRWLQTSPAEYAVSVTPDGAGLRVIVDAVRDGQYVTDEDLTVRYGGRLVALDAVAPGRYEGTLDAAGNDGTLVVLTGDRIVATTQVTTPHPEFEMRGSVARMTEIARRTGGERIPEPGLYAPELPSRSVPIWPPFAALAGLAFLLELLGRRLAEARSGARAT